MKARPVSNEWKINFEQFPAGGSPEEKLGFVLNYAILAPSSHNTQPWLFQIEGSVLEVMADMTRALPVTDPDGRELVMSCGAALFHIRLALQYFGYASEVEMFPDRERTTLLARLTLGLRCESETDQIVLFQSIPRRRTNRSAFRDSPLPESLLGELRTDAEAEGAWLLSAASEPDRVAIADLVAEADRIQWANRKFRGELAAWLRPNKRPGRDGIPGYAEGLEDLSSQVGPLVVRTFDLGKNRAAKDRDIALYSPVLAVVGTDGDAPIDWMRAGQALARVLLRARSEDAWASFLNQAIEVPDIRERLRADLGCPGCPQLLVRFGYADEVPPTPRRPLKQVLTRAQRGSIRIVSGWQAADT